MGRCPSATAAALLLGITMLVGSGVGAGGSVVEKPTDEEEGERDTSGDDQWVHLSREKRWRWNAASGWLPRDRQHDYDWMGRGGDGSDARSRRLGSEGIDEGGVEAEIETMEHQLSDAEEQEEVARQRDYLNGLVSKSAARTREQACNIAFAKTHKTASTTLAMILVRYARRHDKKLASFGGNHVSAIPLPEAVQQVRHSGERVDVMHYHYTDTGMFSQRWEQATHMYEQIMQDGERISYVSVVRNQRAHFLSYYYYFVQPEVQLSVEHFFNQIKREDLRGHKQRLMNPLCLEFGIHNKDQLVHFIQKELPDFRLVLLTEEFDEGLMVLRRLMGWDMIDMTYSRMMETKKGTRRWDGKNLLDVPKFESLPKATQDAIDAHTSFDRTLYHAAEKLYRARKEVAAIEIEAELEEFERLQEVVNGYLARNESSEARHWYTGSVQPYLGGPPFYPF